jgi:hypothetical protein
MKIPSDVMEDLKDQASQIIYFDSATADEDEAYMGVLTRLVHIYKAGVDSK